ncbi:MAG: hypothetical protein JWN51_184 [Phycisphaerales bacterium]|nr:hypothetical protein [Phycisphaerales bacterium]
MSVSPDPVSPLPYATPHAARRIRFSWLVCISSGAVILVASIFLTLFVPKMEGLFIDFHLDLPGPTQMLLVGTRFYLGGGWIGAVFLPFVLGALGPRLVSRREMTDVAALIRLTDRLIAVVIVMILIQLVIIIAVILWLMPMVTLMNGISGSKH